MRFARTGVFSKTGSLLPATAVLLIMQAAPNDPLQGAAGATQPPPTGPAYVGGQPDAFQRAQRQRAQPDEQTDPTADMQRLLCVEREDPAIGASMGPPPRGSPPCPPHAH